MDRIINFGLLSNPANWVIIFGVLYLCALIAKVLSTAAQSGTAITPAGL